MAEAFLRESGGEYFSVESAGLESGNLNPLVIATMQEAGIDISEQTTTLVEDVVRQGRRFDYVITVCDATSGQRCPVFPGQVERIHWTFDDPAAVSGADKEKLTKVRVIREQIRERVAAFLRGFSPVPSER